MAALDLRAGAVATDINAAVNPDRRAASVGRSPRLAALGAGNLTLRRSGRAGEGRTGLAGEEAWLGWTQRCGGPGPRRLGLEPLCTQPGRAGRTLPHGCHHVVPPAAWSTRAQGARRCAPPPTPVYTTALQPEAQGGWRPDTQPPSPTPCRRAERWPALAGRRPALAPSTLVGGSWGARCRKAVKLRVSSAMLQEARDPQPASCPRPRLRGPLGRATGRQLPLRARHLAIHVGRRDGRCGLLPGTFCRQRIRGPPSMVGSGHTAPGSRGHGRSPPAHPASLVPF